jgi:hypothetical protein
MDELKEKVISALENSDYDWRTLKGMSEDLGISQEKIKEIISKLDEIVVQSSTLDKDGNNLYTTRKHYNKTQSFLKRSINAASGSIKY